MRACFKKVSIITTLMTLAAESPRKKQTMTVFIVHTNIKNSHNAKMSRENCCGNGMNLHNRSRFRFPSMMPMFSSSPDA